MTRLLSNFKMKFFDMTSGIFSHTGLSTKIRKPPKTQGRFQRTNLFQIATKHFFLAAEFTSWMYLKSYEEFSLKHGLVFEISGHVNFYSKITLNPLVSYKEPVLLHVGLQSCPGVSTIHLWDTLQGSVNIYSPRPNPVIEMSNFIRIPFFVDTKNHEPSRNVVLKKERL